VICFDNNPDMFEKSKVSVKDNMHVLQAGGVISENDAKEASSRISYTSDITVLAKECGFVIEAVFEDMAVKTSVFQQLDAHAPPHVILASNTSSLSISAIADTTSNKSRVLAVHFLHPAHLVPLVEITPTPHTAPAIVEKTRELLLKIGKSPVLLKKKYQDT